MHALIVLAAAVAASYIAGSLWYLALGKPWRAALGWDPAARYRPAAVELLVGLVGQALMAATLAMLFTALHFRDIRSAIELAAMLWLGLLLPALVTNITFQRRDPKLIVIDGLHWLLVLVVQGAVIRALLFPPAQ